MPSIPSAAVTRSGLLFKQPVALLPSILALALGTLQMYEAPLTSICMPLIFLSQSTRRLKDRFVGSRLPRRMRFKMSTFRPN